MEGLQNQEDNKQNVSNDYLNEILKKYLFIQEIHITDVDCIGIAQAERAPNEDKNYTVELRNVWTYDFSSTKEQTAKTENWTTKSIITEFDGRTVFQSIMNKSCMVHIICQSETYNHEVLKEIVKDLEKRMLKVDADIENVKKETQ